MVVALSERAYTVLKRAFKERTVDKRYHAAGAGTSGSVQRHHRRADRPAPRPRLEVRRHRERHGTASPTTTPSRCSAAASLLDIHLETGRTHQIRVHFAALHHPCCGRPHLRRRPDAGQTARPGTAVAARPVAGVRASRRRPTHRDHQPVPGRSAARTGRAAHRLVTRAAGPPRSSAPGCCSASAPTRSWGLFPAFFPLLKPAGALEILAHRIVWSAGPDGRGAGRRAPARRPAGASTGGPGCCWCARRR